MDQTEALPDDALADILGRLEACDLAASRCVRETWRAVVDARGLLLPHVLPHSLHGIFINYIDHKRPRCFSRPTAKKPVIDGNLDFLPGYDEDSNPIVDHCNGLLLFKYWMNFCVVNPTTRRWEPIRYMDDEGRNAYLVFDPASSPHYEVLLIPDVPKKVILPSHDEQEDPDDSMEWPPSLWMLDVFSSSAKKWQKRSFSREGTAVGTVTRVRADPLVPRSMGFNNGPRWRCGVYWGRSLYVHCRGAYVARFSLTGGMYQVIKMPEYIPESKPAQYLGKSENGVYLATIHYVYQIRIYNLVESNTQIDWVLKHYVDVEPWVSVWLCDLSRFKKTWTLDGDDDKYEREKGDNIGWNFDNENDGDDDPDEDRREEVQDEKEKGKVGGEHNGNQMVENLEWDSDHDNDLTIQEEYGYLPHDFSFFGFHPYKEVIFLRLSSFVGVAYHLKNSKIQYLGNMRPDYYRESGNGFYESFPYTPCMIGNLRKDASWSERRG